MKSSRMLCGNRAGEIIIVCVLLLVFGAAFGYDHIKRGHLSYLAEAASAIGHSGASMEEVLSVFGVPDELLNEPDTIVLAYDMGFYRGNKLETIVFEIDKSSLVVVEVKYLTFG